MGSASGGVKREVGFLGGNQVRDTGRNMVRKPINYCNYLYFNTNSRAHAQDKTAHFHGHQDTPIECSPPAAKPLQPQPDPSVQQSVPESQRV